jgi:hypothetical protein
MTFIFRLFCLSIFAFSAYGQASELYVVDVGPNRGAPWQVVKYDANGENPEVFINIGLNRPQDIVFIEDQDIALVSNLGGNRITKYNASTGSFLGEFASGIGQPTRMEIGEDNLLYVLQWAGNGRVWRYDLDGNFIDEFTDVGVSNSIGMDWDSQGNLYVASFNLAHVRKFDSNGNDLGVVVNTNLQGPTNIWFDQAGDLLVVDWNGQSIRKYDSNGVFKSNLVTGLAEPEGIEFLDNGDFLVGNGGTSSVKQYDSNGSFVKDFVPFRSGGLMKPNGLRFRKGPPFQMNAGLNDAWFDPDTDGQGFYVAVFPETGLVTLAWFTYDTGSARGGQSGKLGDPGHRWMTALGSFEGNQSVMDISVASGGVFDAPGGVNQANDGTITLSFENCNSGTVSYNITSDNLQGNIPIRRIVNDNVALCEALAGE